MPDQAPSIVDIQPSCTPRRTFLARCSLLSVYVLPAKCLDNTPLKDPETSKTIASLRQQHSRKGFCYVRVLRVCASGDLYWADVSARPKLSDTWHVVLTESDLAYALPWDERLYHLSRAKIRRLMFAQARDLEPLRPHKEPEQTEAAPLAPSVVQQTIAVNSEDLREALAPTSARSKKHQNSSLPHWSNRLDFQQWLLRAVLRTLQKQVAYAQNGATAQALQARCALLEDILKWQHQTHRRVVYVDQSPSSPHRSVWLLTLEVPETLLATGDSSVAAA